MSTKVGFDYKWPEFLVNPEGDLTIEPGAISGTVQGSVFNGDLYGAVEVAIYDFEDGTTDAYGKAMPDLAGLGALGQYGADAGPDGVPMYMTVNAIGKPAEQKATITIKSNGRTYVQVFDCSGLVVYDENGPEPEPDPDDPIIT